MYSNAAAVFRADITGALVEQAANWEANLIGEKVLPVINVPVNAGLYPIFNLAAGNLLRNEVKPRAPYGSFPRGNRSFDQDTYATIEYGFEEAIDDTVAKNMARFFDAEQLAAKQALRKVRLAHEVRVQAVIQNATTFPTTASGTAYTIANIATFDIGLDVQSALNRLRQKGEDSSSSTVVMSDAVYIRALASTKLQNRLRGIGISSDTILDVDTDAVAKALGVKQVLVGRAYYDGSNEGASFSSTAIWNDTYVWVGNVGPSGDVMSMFSGGCAYTINWNLYGAAFGVETYRDERITSDIVRSKQHVTEKVVNSNAGTIIATQYS